MSWPAELARALVEGGVEAAAWVPDKRLSPVAAGLPDLRTLTREEECVGWAAGFRAAGGMPLVLMQSSGLGNALNAIGSLVVPYGLGFPLVISLRGGLGERNPAQMPLGRAAHGLLAQLGVEAFSLRRGQDAALVARGALAVAEGARMLAPIVLEAELDL
jgi:sulfopyruvate decarboxylase subunit alpha